MLDIETVIFSEVLTAIRASLPDMTVYVSGEYVRAPSGFPFVSIVEMDNTVYERAQSLSRIENMVNLVYEVNVFSNLTAGKKSECKKIMAVIDAKMLELGFRRMSLNPVQNLEDATVYRVIARYQKLHS